MDKKYKALSAMQLRVLRSSLELKVRALQRKWQDEETLQFAISRKSFEDAAKKYDAKAANAALAAVLRSPATYIKGGYFDCYVQVNHDALDDYIGKKFGPRPTAPKHPNLERATVMFPAFDANAQLKVPANRAAQFEALSARFTNAVLNGLCDGLVEAINTLG